MIKGRFSYWQPPIVIHGWLDDVERTDGPLSLRVSLRLQDGRRHSITISCAGPSLSRGDEIGIAVTPAYPAQLLAVLNYTTGQGANLVRDEKGDICPATLDVFAPFIVAAALAPGLGWRVFPSLAGISLVHWVVTRAIPAVRRRRAAARVDYELDREYRRWRSNPERATGGP